MPFVRTLSGISYLRNTTGGVDRVRTEPCMHRSFLIGSGPVPLALAPPCGKTAYLSKIARVHPSNPHSRTPLPLPRVWFGQSSLSVGAGPAELFGIARDYTLSLVISRKPWACVLLEN